MTIAIIIHGNMLKMESVNIIPCGWSHDVEMEFSNKESKFKHRIEVRDDSLIKYMQSTNKLIKMDATLKCAELIAIDYFSKNN